MSLESSKPVKNQRSILQWLDKDAETDQTLLDTILPISEVGGSVGTTAPGETFAMTGENVPEAKERAKVAPTLEGWRISSNKSVFGSRSVYRYANRSQPQQGIDTKMVHLNNQSKECLQRRSHVLVHLIRRNHGPFRLASRNVWTECDTVALGLGSQHTLSSGTTTCTHVQFDSQGILLAVSDSKGYIRIYDFDEVQSHDLNRRRHRARLQNNYMYPVHIRTRTHSCTIPTPVLPTITFKSLSRVSCLKWNPNNEDEIAISFTYVLHWDSFYISFFFKSCIHSLFYI